MPEAPSHVALAAGRWHTMTLAEQLGNVGSEVSRAVRAKGQGNEGRMNAALGRALELFDLTAADPRLLGGEERFSGPARSCATSSSATTSSGRQRSLSMATSWPSPLRPASAGDGPN